MKMAANIGCMMATTSPLESARYTQKPPHRLMRERWFGVWRSVAGVPDQGKDVVIILSRSLAEIGIKLLGTELRCGD